MIDLRADPGARPLLIVHSSDDMYGADRMVLEVIQALGAADRGRVVVWLPTDYEHGTSPLCRELETGGISVEHVELPILRRRYVNARGLAMLARRARRLRSRIAALDPAEVILATSAVLPVAPLISGRRSYVTLHMQEVWSSREATLLGALGSRVDHVIAISEATRDSLPSRMRERTSVVPNGTADPPLVVPLEGRHGELTFVVASRWTARKGYEFLLRSWDRAGCPGRLVILGGPPPVGDAVDVPLLVSRLSHPETVDVRGEVLDVGRFIEEADVIVVPSTKPEAFGLVTIEAFARERPVIATALGGSLELVREGTGWLVEADDDEGLANLLAGLTRDEVVAAGVRARERYVLRYSRAAFQEAIRSSLGLGKDASPKPVRIA